nr:hypothetical protein [Actinomycetales bacterium]
MIPRPLRFAALAAAAALLVGCQTPGTAALVNGERITDREVTQFVAEAQELLGQGVSPAAGVSNLTIERVIAPVAEEYDELLSDQEVLEMLNSIRVMSGQAEVTLSDVSDPTIAALRAEMWSMNIQSGQVSEDFAYAAIDALTTADVTVNPRYQMYGAEGTLFEGTPNEWIATTAGSRP